MQKSIHTYLMSHCKCSMKAIILNDGTASLWRADGADIRHAQGVTGVVATEVLDEWNIVRPNSLWSSAKSAVFISNDNSLKSNNTAMLFLLSVIV